MQIKTHCNQCVEGALHAFYKATAAFLLPWRTTKITPAIAGGILNRTTVNAMKLTFVLMTAIVLNVAAKGFGQSITLSGKEMPVEKVLQAVKKQTSYMVAYSKQVLSTARPVTLDVRNMPLEEFMQLLLKDQPLKFTVQNNTIFITERPLPTPSASTYRYLPEAVTVQDITGTLVNARNNEPLSGASVHIVGQRVMVAADENGRFSIKANIGDVLMITSVGFATKTIKITSANIGTIAIEPYTKKLTEVVINKGYYTESQRLSTGNVTSVNSKIIERQPVTNVLQALQGRMPGVSIVQNNGFPGASIDVQVRGVNSMLRTSQPLYIVDGVPFLSDAINAQTGNVINGANGATSPLNSFNPSDIESIEVLKDGDATAIYGSRGANGVILITTKKGRAGKTKLDINMNTGMSKVSHLVPTLNTEEFLALRKKGFENSKITPTASNAPDLMIWDQDKYTNFQKLLIGNTANFTDLNMSLSGGDFHNNFLLSGTYHHETTVYYLDKFYKRGGANFSFNHSSIDNKFKAAISATYTADNNTLAVEDLTSRAYQLAPNFPLYNPDGSLYWSTDFLSQNPLGPMMRTNRNKSTNLNTSLNLRYEPVTGLEFKVLGGFGRADMEQAQLTPQSSQDQMNTTNVSRAAFAYSYTKNYIVEPQVSYTKLFGKHRISSLVGGSWQYRRSRQPYYVIASDFISDDFLENLSSAATVSTYSSSTDYKFASVLGRLNYVYNDKYVLNAIFRRDGSSRFGPNNRFGNFGSIGAAWLFTEESFFNNRLKWLSSGKLRGSYGITGSDNIPNYGYLDSYSTSTYSFNGTTGLVPSRIANGNFRWEETKKLEGALELGILDDRLQLTAAYYRNTTGNQLVSYTISSQTGFSSYQANLPAQVQNSGFEFSLNSVNIRSKYFTWSTNFNITANRNKLKAFPNIEKSSYYTTYIVGNPVSSTYLYKYAGYDSLGLPVMTDLNGDKATTFGLAAIGRGDRYFVGTQYPKFYGGLTNTFTYRGVTLDFTFQFVKQKGRSLSSSGIYPPGYSYNLSKDVLEEYLAATGPNQQAVLASFNSAASNYFSSDRTFVDASYIRMKNFSFSYDFSPTLMKRAYINQARLFIQGQNLFTITSYKGFDPESRGVSLPPLRTFSAGFKLSF